MPGVLQPACSCHLRAWALACGAVALTFSLHTTAGVGMCAGALLALSSMRAARQQLEFKNVAGALNSSKAKKAAKSLHDPIREIVRGMMGQVLAKYPNPKA